ncbi:phage integrase Arm DNA-binding domain-containing protein [Acinetobacter sp. MD2(2019)]|uniref:phage integrase Arm DNA-binding domain-containing protein n=1 Tax=Acinetobacter sp. MD2(2019) TaxID=2605273 RepID=UPI002D1F8D00|nr:phage integrase Arm DNA-binding domain-containing protein [Acinetobacter sp. MD2(2019)]MEB3754893.1 phage integrase Arm DNA-binding domain-containing protein [Acinetobacter sp. MD2(2019)]
MARPRINKNRDLPANLYRNGSGWRYRHPVTGLFTSIGTDKQKAINAARKLNDLLIPNNNLITKVIGEGMTFTEVADDYLAQKTKKNGKPLSSTTINGYTCAINKGKKLWAKMPLDNITLLMVSQLLDSMSVSASNHCRIVLIGLFDYAVSKGLCPDNPVTKTLSKGYVKARKRHTIDGLIKIRSASPFWLQNAIDLAMLTAQRRSDILKMKWSDIRDGYLHVVQQKTTEESDDEFETLEGAGYIRIKITPELQSILDRCNDGVESPFIIHRVPDPRGRHSSGTREHPTQVDLKYLTYVFKNVSNESGAYPKYSTSQMPTFHEIRALALFLHKKENKSGQKIAGHSTSRMTEHYESGHDIIWNDATPGILLPYSLT